MAKILIVITIFFGGISTVSANQMCNTRGNEQDFSGGPAYSHEWLTEFYCQPSMSSVYANEESLQNWFLRPIRHEIPKTYYSAEIEINDDLDLMLDSWKVQQGTVEAVAEELITSFFSESLEDEQLSVSTPMCLGAFQTVCDQVLEEIMSFHQGFAYGKNQLNRIQSATSAPQEYCQLKAGEPTHTAKYLAGLGLQAIGELSRLSVQVQAAQRASQMASSAMEWPQTVPIDSVPSNAVPKSPRHKLNIQYAYRLADGRLALDVVYDTEAYTFTSPLFWLWPATQQFSSIDLSQTCDWEKNIDFVGLSVAKSSETVHWTQKIEQNPKQMSSKLATWFQVNPYKFQSMNISESQWIQLKLWDSIFQTFYHLMYTKMSSELGYGKVQQLQIHKLFTERLGPNTILVLAFRELSFDLDLFIREMQQMVNQAEEELLNDILARTIYSFVGPSISMYCTIPKISQLISTVAYTKEVSVNGALSWIDDNLCEPYQKLILGVSNIDVAQVLTDLMARINFRAQGFLAVVHEQKIDGETQVQISRILLPDISQQFKIISGIFQQSFAETAMLPDNFSQSEIALWEQRAGSEPEIFLASLTHPEKMVAPFGDLFLKNWLAGKPAIAKNVGARVKYLSGKMQQFPVEVYVSQWISHYELPKLPKEIQLKNDTWAGVFTQLTGGGNKQSQFSGLSSSVDKLNKGITGEVTAELKQELSKKTKDFVGSLREQDKQMDENPQKLYMDSNKTNWALVNLGQTQVNEAQMYPITIVEFCLQSCSTLTAPSLAGTEKQDQSSDANQNGISFGELADVAVGVWHSAVGRVASFLSGIF